MEHRLQLCHIAACTVDAEKVIPYRIPPCTSPDDCLYGLQSLQTSKRAVMQPLETSLYQHRQALADLTCLRRSKSIYYNVILIGCRSDEYSERWHYHCILPCKTAVAGKKRQSPCGLAVLDFDDRTSNRSLHVGMWVKTKIVDWKYSIINFPPPPLFDNVNQDSPTEF